MPDAPTTPAPRAWRGSVVIRTRSSINNASWPLGSLRIEENGFALTAVVRRMAFKAEEVVELRLSRRPFPTLTFVAQTGDGYELGSFSVLRMSRLQEILATTGLQPTSRQGWNIGGDFRRDTERYGLWSKTA